MKDISIANAYVSEVLRGAAAAGYDTQRILKDCGISPRWLAEGKGRVSLDAFVMLVRRTMSLMNDEALGLLERPQRIGTFAMVARAVLHGPDLGSVIEQFSRSNNLLENGFDHEIMQSDDQVIYRLSRRSSQSVKSNYAVESAVMTAHRFFCWLCRARIPLEQVSLDYASPSWREEHRYLFYGTPVSFNHRHTSIVMRAEHMALPVKQDLRSLELYIERAPQDLFTPRLNQSLAHQVRQKILSAIQSGHDIPSMEEVAAVLALHPQTLRRRLRAEQADFREIRTQARRDVAIWLLNRDHYTVEGVAETLGYSESSAFIRAFKDWMGMTPLAYRRG